MPHTKEPAADNDGECPVPPEPEEPVPLDDGLAESEFDDLEFQSLDTRVVRMWQVIGVIVYGSLCLVLLIAGCLLWVLTPFPKGLILSVWLLALSLLVVNVFWYPHRCYARWSYCLGTRTLELRFGIVWHVSVLIPLSRVQHVDMHRDPLERRAGLASLDVHTAGTRNASHRLPGLGLEVARRLRDRLIASANLIG